MIQWIFIFLTLPALLFPAALTLEEARARALEHNNLLKAQQARVLATESTVKRAMSYRLPSVDLSSSFISTNQPASVFALELNQKQFSLADMAMGDPNNPDMLDTFLTSLHVILPIYTGGQLSSGIAAAKDQAEGFAFEYERKRQELVRQVTKIYLGVILGEEYAALTEKAVETVGKHMKMAEDYYETGFIVESDVLRAKVELSRVEDRLIKARNGARLARLGLNILMGEDPDTVYDLGSVEELKKDAPAKQDAAVEAALVSRPDLKFLEKMVSALKNDAKRISGKRYPSVGLMVSQEWYDDTFLGDTGDATTFAVGVTVPLFTGGKLKAERGEADARISEMEHNLKALEEGVIFQVKEALLRLNEASHRIEVAGGNVEAAQKNLKIIEERYRKGIVRITDLLDADTSLTEAETRSLNARFDYLLAIEEYNLAVGKEAK